ncbi:hypothetical protein ASPACDRAFT_1853532 [Aspergillus aculeatus ATCC 16872]|uniref:O-methyltransferase C-terminal domain-containing protein n=1 Tax=Aspergillus aculeatus (strain ATCC 16872 / CBS 172.66 / WB 5094) TaxID=690307 RepID=A0A1L9X3Q5_ASPA1|nr:uncharacterized protein ASPACDRAFT_1853532 [Aspergillus aculeatus ATCC 16872]OJK02964.1 hypothetical protein ASPACDRAFT_1853532 [Aspergillus aculeatus ATCC 16872]
MGSIQPSLESLGATIAALTHSLAGQLNAAGQPQPSFAVNAPAAMPQDPKIQDARMKLLETLETLHHLVTGPSDFWFQQSMFPNHALLTFDVFNTFNLWSAVPLHGSASYADIARTTDLPEPIVRRFLRLAFTIFVFAEEGSPGNERVVHTAASAHMARYPYARAFLAHNLEDVRPAATVGVEALKRWFVGRHGAEVPEEITACAIPLATDHDGRRRGADLWEFLENFERLPEQPRGFRAKRFAEAMQGLRETSGVMTEEVLRRFDWGGLGHGATVVDLGGSAGHISVILAEHYPKLNLIVQDLASAQSAFEANISSTPYASRITFQTHNFFDPQSCPADVFLLKSVLHDWSDKYVRQIVRNLLGVLKPGNHLLVFDFVVPAEYDDAQNKLAIPLPVRKSVAAMDLQMHVACNSKERTIQDWTDVIKQADTCFDLREVHLPAGSPLGMLDFVFQG